MRGSIATAREVIQRAIASVLDTDTSGMRDDEEKFVDALDSLNDPRRAMDALNVLDQLSARYERELPQVEGCGPDQAVLGTALIATAAFGG